MKGKVSAVVVCFILVFGIFSTAKADTILFPVIAVNQPNVTTIVSVLNRHSWGTSTHLHYIYRYKQSLVDGEPNISGDCISYEFTRPTWEGDLVSFDASGSLNGGNALFGDTNNYGEGFAMPGSGPRRAYLLVTNSDAAGNRVDVTDKVKLMGEAIIMDIAYGAAWGYRAINDLEREDYSFRNVRYTNGGVYSALPSHGYVDRRFTFFPPSEWTTRFFVTPIGWNMHSQNLTATVALEVGVIYDRNGNRYTFTPIDKTVRCTAAIDLKDLVDATVWSAIENIGGWSWFGVTSGDAIVYKLEYVLENPTYGGTNNNGYLLSTYARP